MAHLAHVTDKISPAKTAQAFEDVVFRLHGLPDEIVSDRDACSRQTFGVYCLDYWVQSTNCPC
ncbi:hypothetical protein Plhal304r1_c002g0005821 [Plasmopara halstedii]